MKLIPVPAAVVHRAWPHVQGFIAEVPQEEMGIGDILHHLREKNLQLWAFIEGEEFVAALITEIVHHPQMSVVRVRFAGGRRAREWMPLIRDVVVPWAKSYGCTRLEVIGRPGWARLVNRYSGADTKLETVGVVMRGEI